MLVGYSSSSSSEGEAEDGGGGGGGGKRDAPGSLGQRRQVEEEEDASRDLPKKKRLKTEEQMTRSRLPLPGCLADMFPDEEEPAAADDSALHGGRVRSFKHERGNWATYVYFPYPPEDDFAELLEELLSVAGSRGVVLTPQDEFHLSLSQTVVLRHHWIQPFAQSLKAGLAGRRRFLCSAGRLKVYCNAERTRTFLGMEVTAGDAQLLDLVRVVDRTMNEFHLETFYEEPSFHVSLAWCVGDLSARANAVLQELQRLVDEHEDGAFALRLDCSELRCRTGNKTFRFPLKA